MQDPVQYYFPKGCPECGRDTISLMKEAYIYKCLYCGAFAGAHRLNTAFSKKYEPYQYIANVQVNDLRKAVENVFNPIWQERIPSGDEREFIIPINVIYPKNIRVYELTKNDPVHVKVLTHDKEKNTCDVYVFETAIVHEDVNYTDLRPTTNRMKAHIWLAEKLGAKITECKIGYLSEAQLKWALEVCSDNLNNVRKKYISSSY